MRTIVDLPKEQIAALAAFCEKERISRAEAVRRAVSELLKKNATPPPDISEFFGMWKREHGEVEDGLAYQRRLRAEWPE